MENSSLFGITYNDWKTFVGAYLAQGNNYMNNYILLSVVQTYTRR